MLKHFLSPYKICPSIKDVNLSNAFATSHYSISSCLFAIVMVMHVKIYGNFDCMHFTHIMENYLIFLSFRNAVAVYYRYHVYTSVSVSMLVNVHALNCSF